MKNMPLLAGMMLIMVMSSADACQLESVIDSSNMNTAFFNIRTGGAVNSSCIQQGNFISCCAAVGSFGIELNTNENFVPILPQQLDVVVSSNGSAAGVPVKYIANSTGLNNMSATFDYLTRSLVAEYDAGAGSLCLECFGSAGACVTITEINKSYARFIKNAGDVAVTAMYGNDGSHWYTLGTCAIPNINTWNSQALIAGQGMYGSTCQNVTLMSMNSSLSFISIFSIKDQNNFPINNCSLVNTEGVYGQSPYWNQTQTFSNGAGLTSPIRYESGCLLKDQGYEYDGYVQVSCANLFSTQYITLRTPALNSIQNITMINTSISDTENVCLETGEFNRSVQWTTIPYMSVTVEDENGLISHKVTDNNGRFYMNVTPTKFYTIFFEGNSQYLPKTYYSHVSGTSIMGLPPGQCIPLINDRIQNPISYGLSVHVDTGNLTLDHSANRIRIFNCNDDGLYTWLENVGYSDPTGSNCRNVFTGWSDASWNSAATFDLTQFADTNTVYVLSENIGHSDHAIVNFEYVGQNKSVTLSYSGSAGYFNVSGYKYSLSFTDCNDFTKTLSVSYVIKSKDGSFIKSGTGNNVTFERNVSQDTYRITASASGYSAFSSNEFLDYEIDRVICLVSSGTISYSNVTARGTVFDITNSQYLPDYDVSVNCEDGSTYSTHTNSTGSYVFKRIPTGIRCTYSAGDDGTYSEDSKSVSLFADGIIPRLDLQKSSVKSKLQQFYVKFQQTNGDYSPLVGVQVRISCDDGRNYDTQETDGSGFAKSYIPINIGCIYSVEYPNYRTESARISSNPELINLKISGLLGCTLSGQLQDRSGSARNGIEYFVYSKGLLEFSGVTGDNGIYSTSVTCGGDYIIVAKDGNCTSKKTIGTAEAETGSYSADIKVASCNVDREQAKEGVISSMWAQTGIFILIISAFFIMVLLAVVSRLLKEGKGSVDNFKGLIDSITGK